MAWEQQVQRLVVEVDSDVVVGFFQSGINDMHILSFLVRLCYIFLRRDWLVRVIHVYREVNRVVDSLANHAFSLPLGFHSSSSSSPSDILELVTEDANGSIRVRFVRLG
ncbi:unnamed protein product [Microthlaspi erraticum]|uniref:RNase H type-1 domain-containing protein n=1 Tax=Microthlaspi erraticum TaxID=1685480 RepID=A0A6D2KKX7_9BRAS|nr:unnamed protein product [Microthlaspi erraticum]